MMKLSPIALVPLALAIATGLTGCDWIWSSSKETVAKQAIAPPPPSSTPAPAPALSPPLPPTPQPTATATAAPQPPVRMTLSEQADFDAWMIKTYLACWKPAAQPADADPYVAQVRLAFKPDGSLSKSPKLVNPPSNPALKPQAKSVIAAVRACNPLQVPAQYRPFYEQWKTKTVHFNPQVAAR